MKPAGAAAAAARTVTRRNTRIRASPLSKVRKVKRSNFRTLDTCSTGLYTEIDVRLGRCQIPPPLRSAAGLGSNRRRAAPAGSRRAHPGHRLRHRTFDGGDRRDAGNLVVGLDRSSAMLIGSAQGASSCLTSCGDGAALPFAGIFDAVFSAATFHWIPDHDRLFASIYHALKAGGRLVAQCGGARQSAAPVRAGAAAAGIAALQGMVRILVGPLAVRGGQRHRGAAGTRRVHRNRRVARIDADHVRRRRRRTRSSSGACACGTSSTGCRFPNASASSPT